MKKYAKELAMEALKGAVKGFEIAIVIAIILAMLYHWCYHIDGQHGPLFGNYTILEERFTDFFGNDICSWERKIPKDPMDIVIYEKWF